MKHSILEYYRLWCDEEDAVNPFNSSDEWIGSYVEGFITFVLTEEGLLPECEVRR